MVENLCWTLKQYQVLDVFLSVPDMHTQVCICVFERDVLYIHG